MKRVDKHGVPNSRFSKSVIQENMPVILTWVATGYTLKSIYHMLQGQEVLSCSFSHFEKCYYRFKKEVGVSQSDMLAKKSTPRASQPTASTRAVVPKAAMAAVTKPSVTAQPITAELNDDGEAERNEPEKKKAKNFISSESDLEMNERIARATFAENRNKQKRRRRHSASKQEVNDSQSAESTKT